MFDAIQSVSQLTAALRFLLEREYRFVAVSGEISNLRQPGSGHQYFTLKDEGAQLKAVLLKPQQRYLAVPLRDGQQVVCRGRISVYEPRGEYQLVVDTVATQGEGVLQQQFVQLKAKLATEGLFTDSRKRPLPIFPQKIVLITSPSGAAVHDFITIWRQRQSVAQLLIYPTAVQGKTAAAEIATAIAHSNILKDVDALVLCRGGGSLEDLWAFNDEHLARAIVNSAIPVITGIGHEIDFTIADFCADRRAPTPTGAAELLLPDCRQLRVHLHNLQNQLVWRMLTRLDRQQQSVQQLGRLLPQAISSLDHASLRLDFLYQGLLTSQLKKINEWESQLTRLQYQLEQQRPQEKLQRQEVRFQQIWQKLYTQLNQRIAQGTATIAHHTSLLQSYSPLATLSRGYAIVRKSVLGNRTGQLIRSSNDVTTGETIEVLLHHGRLQAVVTAAQQEENSTFATSSPAKAERAD